MCVFSAKPKFIQQPEDLIVNEGQSAKFTCTADGEPPPTVFWQREGKATMFFPDRRHDRFYVTKFGDLTISNVREEDEGGYICAALSGSGSIQVKAQLTVIGRNIFFTNILYVDYQTKLFTLLKLAVTNTHC